MSLPRPSEIWLLVDIVTSAKRSEMMAGIKGKNTKPEILVRKLLHGQGFRFRLHNTNLPGRPDIVLAKYKTAIFVHGCFWHGHENCSIFRLPKSRTEFWRHKIGANRARDVTAKELLEAQGWKVIYVWECALKGKSRQPQADFYNQISSAIKSDQTYAFEIRGCNAPTDTCR
jgi:DNA mismatch endonuclease, patch repair protein